MSSRTNWHIRSFWNCKHEACGWIDSTVTMEPTNNIGFLGWLFDSRRETEDGRCIWWLSEADEGAVGNAKVRILFLWRPPFMQMWTSMNCCNSQCLVNGAKSLGSSYAGEILLVVKTPSWGGRCAAVIPPRLGLTSFAMILNGGQGLLQYAVVAVPLL